MRQRCEGFSWGRDLDLMDMIQDELWLTKWQEAIDFLETNHRKPSKFMPEERNMRSWWKHNKKLMNVGELKLSGWRCLNNSSVWVSNINT